MMQSWYVANSLTTQLLLCYTAFTTLPGTQPLTNMLVPTPPSLAVAPPPESTPTEQVPSSSKLSAVGADLGGT